MKLTDYSVFDGDDEVGNHRGMRTLSVDDVRLCQLDERQKQDGGLLRGCCRGSFRRLQQRGLQVQERGDTGDIAAKPD